MQWTDLRHDLEGDDVVLTSGRKRARGDEKAKEIRGIGRVGREGHVTSGFSRLYITVKSSIFCLFCTRFFSFATATATPNSPWPGITNVLFARQLSLVLNMSQGICAPVRPTHPSPPQPLPAPLPTATPPPLGPSSLIPPSPHRYRRSPIQVSALWRSVR